MSRRAVVLGSAVIAGLLGFRGVTLGCTCAQPSSVEEGLKQSDAVFVGLVERFELKGSARVATLRASRVWKGPKSPHISVTTGGGDGDCGFHFIAGIEYLVFASEDDSGTLRTTICTRTKPASGEAVDDLKALGPGTPLGRR